MHYTLCLLMLTLIHLACAHAHSKNPEAPAKAVMASEVATTAPKLDGAVLPGLFMSDKDEVCRATGAFNLSQDHGFLTMEAKCNTAMREVKAERLTKQPNIFRIPFRDAVVSIMKEGEDEPLLHFHYIREDGHHIVTLHRVEDAKYAYSFENLVPEKAEPLPLTR